MRMEIKQHRQGYEVNLFYSKNSRSHYHTILRDWRGLEQFLIDLTLEGKIDVDKAISGWRERLKKKDWLGL